MNPQEISEQIPISPTTSVTPLSSTSISVPVSVPNSNLNLNSLPLIPVLLLIGFFLLILGALVIWLVVTRNTLNSHNLNQVQSPYCLTVTCPSGTSLLNYQLDPSVSPNTTFYETYNYCSINAPPTSFVQSLELCAGIIDSDQINAGGSSISQPTSAQVLGFADFYNNDYVNTCGWSWKNPSPTIGNSSTFPTSQQADPVTTALVGCAQQLGVSNDSNVQGLISKNPQEFIFPILETSS